MPLRRPIQKAISSLLTFQNEDGGIPAVLPGQQSGAWTTASCLEAFLLCAYSPPDILYYCKNMTNFLLESQLPEGGWPYVSKPPASTLATGHAISSLLIAKNFLNNQSEQAFLSKINLAIDEGFKWLEANQNRDGGWGVQPSLGEDGNLTRISSTYYALRPYWTRGYKYSDSEAVKDGINLLLQYQRPDGGWPFIKGTEADINAEVSNTARSILALLHSEYVTSDSSIVSDGIGFILSQKLVGSSWKLGVEGFSSGSPAVSAYHNNSPCDALEALLVANVFNESTKEAFVWLLNSQREDGIWEFNSPDPTQHGFERAWTWSTAEFIHVLNLASEKYIKHEMDLLIGGGTSEL